MSENADAALPSVSLVIAARNEEACLPQLFAALDAQTYPTDKLEILLGNDGSTDATAELMEAWAAGRPQVRVLHITQKVPGLVGKANVLAQLCRQARYPTFVFTDADCVPPPHWLKGMAQELQRLAPDPERDACVLTGFTVPIGRGAFGRLQACDWLSALSAIHFLSLVRVPVTAMGNNMACTRAAYLAAGGFEQTAGSITEDYALFQNALRGGSSFSHYCHPRVLNRTHAMPTYDAWLTQRKRWFSGAMQLPWLTQFPFWVQAFYYPLMALVAMTVGWEYAFYGWFYKVWFQSMLFTGYMARLRQWKLVPWLPLYDVFAAVTAWALVIAYLKDSSISWKGVQYHPHAKGHTPASAEG